MIAAPALVHSFDKVWLWIHALFEASTLFHLFVAGCGWCTVGWPALLHPQFPAHLVIKVAQEVRNVSAAQATYLLISNLDVDLQTNLNVYAFRLAAQWCSG